MSTTMLHPSRTHTDRVFYTGMAIAMAATVFAGFAPTYYLKGYFSGPPLDPLVHVHGAFFTAWMLMFFTQTTLIAARRTDVHRRLGLAGVVLAIIVVILGIATAVSSIRLGRTPPGIDPRSFLVLPFGDILSFAVLTAAGISYRKQPEAHKRLMLLATIAMLDAAIARLPGLFTLGPIAFFAVQDLFVLAGPVYDYVSRRRIHPAYIWGGLFIVVMQPLRLFLSQTPLWLAFGDWIKG